MLRYKQMQLTKRVNLHVPLSTCIDNNLHVHVRNILQYIHDIYSLSKFVSGSAKLGEAALSNLSIRHTSQCKCVNSCCWSAQELGKFYTLLCGSVTTVCPPGVRQDGTVSWLKKTGNNGSIFFGGMPYRRVAGRYSACSVSVRKQKYRKIEGLRNGSRHRSKRRFQPRADQSFFVSCSRREEEKRRGSVSAMVRVLSTCCVQSVIFDQERETYNTFLTVFVNGEKYEESHPQPGMHGTLVLGMTWTHVKIPSIRDYSSWVFEGKRMDRDEIRLWRRRLRCMHGCHTTEDAKWIHLEQVCERMYHALVLCGPYTHHHGMYGLLLLIHVLTEDILFQVEGLGSLSRGLHPIQKAMAASHASQCGFCTPGFVMSMYALLRNNPRPTMKDIEESFDGNLCRCTGYRPILVRSLPGKGVDDLT